jgi:hypothetical protein
VSKPVKALLAAFALLLALAAPAAAKVKIVAPLTVEGAQPVQFAAAVSQPAEEVAFYVDGRQRYVDHSPTWKVGGSGRVNLGVGRHRLKVTAKENGVVTVTTRSLYVEPASRTEARPRSESAAGSSATWRGTGTKPAAPEATEAPAEETVPTPAEAPAPSYADPDLIFDGGQIGDFGLIQAAPDAISEVADPAGSGKQVLKLTVDDGDVAPVTPTENPRAQALSPGVIHNGDDFWLETKFLLPADLPQIPSWFGLVSIYGAPFDGPSPWCIEINEDEFRWQRNGNSDWDIPWRAPLIKGSWVTILTHERFADDGFIEMWVNGKQINFFAPGNHNPNHHPQTTRLEMATMDSSNYAAPNAAKIMQYRKVGMFKSASVYFDHLKLGKTRASVEG